jgi:hypothetical protein
VRSYLVQYRNKQGRSRRFTIGKHGKITADGARKDALRIFDAVRAGKDPVYPPDTRSYNDLLGRVDPVNLKHVLGDIQTIVVVCMSKAP